MDKKIISGVLIFALIALAIGLMIPGQDQAPTQTFPWQIEVTENGATRVFGLTLGESSLKQAEQIFKARAEISLFDPADDRQQQIIEAYFDTVTLGGLSARIIMVIDVIPGQLQKFYQRGTRISSLGDGSHKVSLHAEDVIQVRNMSIASMTYLSRIRLDSTLLEQRFGKPEQVIIEKASNTTHWLYPDKGLDVALSKEGNGVLQYVPPTRFSQLIEPLQ